MKTTLLLALALILAPAIALAAYSARRLAWPATFAAALLLAALILGAHVGPAW